MGTKDSSSKLFGDDALELICYNCANFDNSREWCNLKKLRRSQKNNACGSFISALNEI